TTDREGMRPLRETERVRPLRERAICRARRGHAEVVDIRNSRTRGGTCTQSAGRCIAHDGVEEALVDLRIVVVEGLCGGGSVALAGSEQATSFVERRCTKPRILFSTPAEFVQHCWRKRGRPLGCIEVRSPVDVAEATCGNIGEAGLTGYAPVLFPRHRE